MRRHIVGIVFILYAIFCSTDAKAAFVLPVKHKTSLAATNLVAPSGSVAEVAADYSVEKLTPKKAKPSGTIAWQGITSLLLGIIAFILPVVGWLPALLAIVIGISGLRRGRILKLLALLGLLLGCLFFVSLYIFLVNVLPL